MQALPLNALRAFEAAGRHCSVTLAAAELHVTPGAVSRQIKLLEEMLGLQLFIRGSRNLRLTPESALLLNALSDGFRRIDSAVERFSEAQSDRPVRIMCSGSVATRWLFPRLRHFHAAHPNREVLLTTSLTTVSAAFDADAADFVIRLGTDPWPAEIVAHRLFDSVLIPVCSPDLLRDGPPLAQPRDLLAHTLLCTEKRPQAWTHWLADAGLPPMQEFKTQVLESSALVLEAAIEGLGVALGERHLISDDLRRRRLVAPLSLPRRMAEGFYLIYRREISRRKNLCEFRNWLLSKHVRARASLEESSNIQAAI